MRAVITSAPLDAPALLAAFHGANPQAGATASFTGQVRAAGGVQALELEIFPGFTEPAVAAAMAALASAVDDLWVLHRYGRIAPGETIVFVAAASAHRRAAFQAVDRAMDWLKAAAPIWKKEHRLDGASWIAPRAQDYADAERWAIQSPQSPV